MSLFLMSVGIALSVSFLCSLMEAALLSLPATTAATLAKSHPAAGKIWQQFRANIERPIAVILVLNTAAHTIGATIAGAEFEVLFGTSYLVVFSLVFTYLMLQFTEILPKTLGVRYNGPISLVLARPLSVLVRIMSPVLWFIHLVNRPFQGTVRQGETTIDEIAALVALAKQAKTINMSQARMLLAASELGELRVRQIMTPRTRVAFLRVGQPIEEILEHLKQSPFTRMPLCGKGIDNVIGLVHVRDLFAQLDLVPGKLDVAGAMLAAGRKLPENGAPPGSGVHVIGSGQIDLMEIRRDILFFPDTTTVQRALKEFQTSRTHLAVVVDEYGSTLGIVSLEDVLEEIVGEIEDEFDRPAPPRVVLEEGHWRVSGDTPMHELQHHLAIPDDIVDAADTVSGYAAEVLGVIPEVGATFECAGYTVRVTSADGRRVREVVFEETTPADEG